ncbi:MAG TPA: ABC transporter ATP-binding protein [Sphingomonadaceae bacterium]|nr:ABC transporter ATP-binding protein [Sphingomonadaceae bacterium]
MAAKRTTRLLADHIDRKQAALLLALMTASGFTEGIGLVLLVPMLAALDPASGETANGIPARLAELGFPTSLEALLAIFVGLVVVRALINHARDLAALDFEARLVDGIRNRAWRALLHCDWRELSAMRQSDNAGLLISNVARAGDGVSQLLHALAAAATLAGLTVAGLAISPPITLAGLAGGALVLLGFSGIRRRAHKLGEDLGAATRRVHGELDEGLGALRAIKSFGAEQRMADRGAIAFAGQRTAYRGYARSQGIAQIALQVGGALALALLVWLAIARWNAGIAEILPLAALFARALPLLGRLQQSWQFWAHARPALDEAEQLIEQAEAAREPDLVERRAEPLQLARSIELEDVSVRFASRAGNALDRINLAIRANSTVAIEGPSGAGKSTLADLIGGLLSPDEGRILVDGLPLDLASRRAWRSRVAYVEQEPVLPGGSVREALLWGTQDASEAGMRDALKRAAADFVFDLPQGLDHSLGEGARQLSGGERQRLALARALLRNPQLLILDEPTSAVDAPAEAEIAKALAALKATLTMVVICHRGSLVDIADRVIGIEAGRVVSDRLVAAS